MGDVWVRAVWASVLTSVWLRGKIRVGEWCCEVVGSCEVEQVARCGFLLPRNLIRTCMCVCVCVNMWVLLCWEGILLTRTRLSVSKLVQYVHEQPQMKGRVLAEKLVGQGQRDGTMTDIQQENTLRRFRAGCQELLSVILLQKCCYIVTCVIYALSHTSGK